jgi:hypothetical protein
MRWIGDKSVRINVSLPGHGPSQRFYHNHTEQRRILAKKKLLLYTYIGFWMITQPLFLSCLSFPEQRQPAIHCQSRRAATLSVAPPLTSLRPSGVRGDPLLSRISPDAIFDTFLLGEGEIDSSTALV